MLVDTQVIEMPMHGSIFPQLTEQETMVASQLVLPSELETSWDDIGGCDDVIVALRENLINPIRLATTHKNPLLRPPKGNLFFL